MHSAADVSIMWRVERRQVVAIDDVAIDDQQPISHVNRSQILKQRPGL